VIVTTPEHPLKAIDMTIIAVVVANEHVFLLRHRNLRLATYNYRMGIDLTQFKIRCSVFVCHQQRRTILLQRYHVEGPSST
jgi:hypothetical protein